MKSPRVSFVSIAGFTALCALSLTGCKESPTPEQQEQEVERRVAQKLNEEKLARQQQELDQKAQDLAAREQQVADREQSARQPAAEPAPAREAGTRDEAPAREAPEPAPAAPGSYDVFYTSLESQGDWFETPQYGLVWQPNAAQADPGWRPYTEGHWAYTDVGWTWVSDEPFGWAAYHYGRWTRLVGTGWVWVPGEQWAPAWVSWRDSDDYVGWAPLPPESGFPSSGDVSIGTAADSQYNIAPSYYAFVPIANFGELQLNRCVVEPRENITIVNRTRNVTRITVNKTVVINNGPSITVVQNRSRRRIDVLKIDRRHDFHPGRTHAVAQNGVLQVTAPVINPREKNKGRPKVKGRLERVAVDRSPQPAERKLPPMADGPQVPREETKQPRVPRNPERPPAVDPTVRPAVPAAPPRQNPQAAPVEADTPGSRPTRNPGHSRLQNGKLQPSTGLSPAPLGPTRQNGEARPVQSQTPPVTAPAERPAVVPPPSGGMPPSQPVPGQSAPGQQEAERVRQREGEARERQRRDQQARQQQEEGEHVRQQQAREARQQAEQARQQQAQQARQAEQARQQQAQQARQQAEQARQQQAQEARQQAEQTRQQQAQEARQQAEQARQARQARQQQAQEARQQAEQARQQDADRSNAKEDASDSDGSKGGKRGR